MSTDLDHIWKIFDSIKLEESPPIQKYDECSNCLSNGLLITDTSNGFYVCIICGLTKSDPIISDCAEINYIDSKKADPSRHGTFDSLFPKSSLSTVISGNSKLSKMNQWNSMPYNERSLWQISQYIQRQCSSHNVNSSVIHNAIALFKQIDDKKKDDGKKEIHRGKVRDGLISACLYYSFKKNNVDRTPLEISEIMNVDIIDVTRGCKLFLDILKMEQLNITIKTPQSTDFVLRFCNDLGTPYHISIKIKKILTEVERLNLLSRNTPTSIVAGTIYFCLFNLNFNVTKKDVGNVCNVSDVTISKIFKKLSQTKTYLMNLIEPK